MATANISQINSEALKEQRGRLADLHNDLDTSLYDIVALADVLGAATSDTEGGLSDGSMRRVAWKIERETQKAHKTFESYRETVHKIENLMTQAKEVRND